MITAIQNRLKSISRDVVRWFKYYTMPKKKESEIPAPDEELGIIADAVSSKPEIALVEAAVLVECVSCGVVHRLSALCINCHEPVCDDPKFCRKSEFNKDINAQAVYCRICASTP
ncbi:MAG: hypothetical protein IH588_12570 [Anaerolineales bacterium]|nr:hypothetical protein [Anaerolineales bacterium]